MSSTADAIPRITFGMIVFNGQPFLSYNLRALYPFAHEIIVVEGAALGAALHATPQGHSSDGTLETLQEFVRSQDPNGKITIVTAEDEGSPDGFWRGEKTEQSRAFARRATGDYLWQVDVDEFYQPADMNRVLEMLRADPEIAAVSFWETTFWGNLETVVNGWYQRRGASEYHRLFKWSPGFVYAEHRPPTVQTPDGTNLRELRWVRGRELAREGIGLYHYSLLFPRQVLEKESYYQAAGFRDEAMKWSVDCYLGLQQPFRVHNVSAYPSWFEWFSGSHPPVIRQLWHDVETGLMPVERRSNEDVVRLMSSRGYPLARSLLKVMDYPDRLRIGILGGLGKLGRRIRQGAWALLRHLLLGR